MIARRQQNKFLRRQYLILFFQVIEQLLLIVKIKVDHYTIFLQILQVFYFDFAFIIIYYLEIFVNLDYLAIVFSSFALDHRLIRL